MLKLTKVFFFSVLFLSLTNLLSAHTRELQMKIMNSSGNPLAATVYMYQVTTEVTGNKKLTLYRQGNSIGGTTWNWTQPDCNVVCDIDDNNTDPDTWNPITYGRYYIRIGSSYCDVYINYYDGSSGDGDFMINYQNGVFSNDVARNNRGITFYGSFTWSASFLITAKNSFGGGDIKFDGTRYNSIPAAGKTFPINATDNPMEASTFPHYVEAIDDGSQVSGGFVQRFENFGGDFGTGTNSVFEVSQPGSGNVTANFKNQYDITFVNSVVGLGNVGTLRINGVEKNMPTSSVPVKQDYSVTAEGTNFIINGIKYLIDHWSDASTSNSRTFYPINHTIYTAYYKGYPQMTTVTINTDETGQPVRLDWTTHQNSAVNQYRVYRGAKVDGNFTNPQIIATLGSAATSYTDYEFVIGGSAPNSVAYDVVPYYSTEDNWGIVGSQVVSATKELLQKQAGEQVEVLADYTIDTYPNPFNPSTKINFTLPEAGFVKLTIYNALGQKIKELVNMQMNQGNYTSTWYGDNEFGKKVNSGIYFSVLESRNRRLVQKMILSK